MELVFFASDLHGRLNRYEALFGMIRMRKPRLVLLGGDLLPHSYAPLPSGIEDFLQDYLRRELHSLKREMRMDYPRILVIMGNDDARCDEEQLKAMEKEALLEYISMRSFHIYGYTFTGYPFVPPTPFLNKDWEKYDVSRFVDPACVAPTEGRRSVNPDYDTEYATIAKDLVELSSGLDSEKAIFLFHAPPYRTKLDRAALDGQFVDHVPLDVNVGSIAIQRFIDDFQPYLCLHGHIHESSRLSGGWSDAIGKTILFGAAWDGQELALISFDLNNPSEAIRELI